MRDTSWILLISYQLFEINCIVLNIIKIKWMCPKWLDLFRLVSFVWLFWVYCPLRPTIRSTPLVSHLYSPGLPNLYAFPTGLGLFSVLVLWASIDVSCSLLLERQALFLIFLVKKCSLFFASRSICFTFCVLRSQCFLVIVVFLFCCLAVDVELTTFVLVYSPRHWFIIILFY